MDGICSLELWGRVTVSLEGTVDDVRALVHKVWHDWLVHGAIPWDISWLSHSVSIDHLVVLVEDWSLPGSPLSVGIWNWRVPWQDSADVPPIEVWVVQQSPLMEAVVVENNWSLISKTPTDSSRHEEDHVCPSDPASDIEVFDWQFSDYSETEKASDLGSGGVVGPVPIGFLGWSRDDFVDCITREP